MRRRLPMLAKAMPEHATVADYVRPNWVLEEKYDGHRIMIRVTDDALDVWSRPRANTAPLTRTLPAPLRDALRTLPVGVYDGELVVPGGTSSHVVRKDLVNDLRVVLFDVVELLDENVAIFNARRRRAMLELAVEHYTRASSAGLVRLSTVQPVSLDAVKAIWAAGGEGAILKNLDATYRCAARSSDWVKVKRQAAAELTITGFEAGRMGAHSVALLVDDDGKATSVKTKDNATRLAIARDPQAFIGKRLVIFYTERTVHDSYKHGGWDHLAAERG